MKKLRTLALAAGISPLCSGDSHDYQKQWIDLVPEGMKTISIITLLKTMHDVQYISWTRKFEFAKPKLESERSIYRFKRQNFGS